MARFIVRRLISMVFVLFVVSVLVFAIFNVLPGGDPAVRMAGKQPDRDPDRGDPRWSGASTRASSSSTRRRWRSSSPATWSPTSPSSTSSTRSGRGCRGRSGSRFGAMVLWMVFSIALGLYSAVRAGRSSDKLLTVLAIIGISMPVFWIGALMNHYLGFKLGLFPNGGYVPLTENPAEWFYHMILPWTALAILFIGVYSRVLRSNVIETMNEDFVRTARAKGLSERQVLLRHVLRNSMIPIVTLWGLDFGARDRRRRDPHRGGLRPPGRRPVRGGRDRPARPAAADRGDDVRRLHDRPLQRDRRHPLRAASTRGSASTAAASARDRDELDRPRQLLAVEDLRVALPDRETGASRRSIGSPSTLQARRGAGDRRRVGLGQVGHRDDPDGADPRARTRRSRAAPASARPS